MGATRAQGGCWLGRHDVMDGAGDAGSRVSSGCKFIVCGYLWKLRVKCEEVERVAHWVCFNPLGRAVEVFDLVSGADGYHA